jgi:hypothetical protein
MAIRYLDGGRITGLSTDTKPDRTITISGGVTSSAPPLAVEAGSEFIETDTGTRYVHNGFGWVQKTFDSISAALGKDTGDIMRTHFVEWFCGAYLNNKRWGKGGDGNETVEMYQPKYTGGSVDTGTIGGGVLLQNSNSATVRPVYISTGFQGTRTSETTADIRQFSHYGASMIWCERHVGSFPNEFHAGFSKSCLSGGGGADSNIIVGAGSLANYKARAILSSAAQRETDTGFPKTKDLTCFRIDVLNTQANECNMRGTINGVLRTTNAYNDVDGSGDKMAINFGMQGSNSTNYNPRNQRVITYCEAWNH